MLASTFLKISLSFVNWPNASNSRNHEFSKFDKKVPENAMKKSITISRTILKVIFSN